MTDRPKHVFDDIKTKPEGLTPADIEEMADLLEMKKRMEDDIQTDTSNTENSDKS